MSVFSVFGLIVLWCFLFLFGFFGFGCFGVCLSGGCLGFLSVLIGVFCCWFVACGCCVGEFFCGVFVAVVFFSWHACHCGGGVFVSFFCCSCFCGAFVVCVFCGFLLLFLEVGGVCVICGFVSCLEFLGFDYLGSVCLLVFFVFGFVGLVLCVCMGLWGVDWLVWFFVYFWCVLFGGLG